MFREHTQSFGTLLEENTNYLLVNPMFLGEQNILQEKASVSRES